MMEWKWGKEYLIEEAGARGQKLQTEKVAPEAAALICSDAVAICAAYLALVYFCLDAEPSTALRE
jgi:hypothetical protein